MIAGNATSDVWSSTDGKKWTRIDENAPFSSAAFDAVTVFGDRIIVAGSSGNQGNLGDIWFSPDGKNWSVEKVRGGFGTRAFNRIVAFKDGLWAIGGFDALNSARDRNDVWYLPLTVSDQVPTATLPVSVNITSTEHVPSGTSVQAGIDPLACNILLLLVAAAGYGIKRRMQSRS
jgi:hypothetical protein